MDVFFCNLKQNNIDVNEIDKKKSKLMEYRATKKNAKYLIFWIVLTISNNYTCIPCFCHKKMLSKCFKYVENGDNLPLGLFWPKVVGKALNINRFLTVITPYFFLYQENWI